jgi:predicted transglutaminase-like cysteine proteinase
MLVTALRQPPLANSKRARPARPRHRLHVVCGFLLGVVVAAHGTVDARLSRSAAMPGAKASAAVQPLRLLLQAADATDPVAQLRAVNRFYNQHIEFATDAHSWGEVDHWASPLEALNKGRGDCEDYAIAKYFTLVAAGLPVSKLRLVYVRARTHDVPAQPHMVLAYYPAASADPLILDNLLESILPASQRSDLAAEFSFNSEGLWHGVGRQRAGDAVARLPRWREVMAKARAEGFL